ncbi:MAG: hypothetical protein ACLFRW_00900 [Halorhodospira sp.]
MERCPNCRARTEATAAHCRRCGMELSLLHATERAATALLEQAAAALASGSPQQARQYLERARALREDRLTEALLGFLEHPHATAAGSRDGPSSLSPMAAPPSQSSQPRPGEPSQRSLPPPGRRSSPAGSTSPSQGGMPALPPPPRRD